MANTARNKPGAANQHIDDGSKALENLQQKYEANKKPINTVLTVILIVIAGYLGYKQFYKTPRENKASAAIYFAQHYYETDSISKALDGDGQHKGFLKIIKSYGGTPTANICHYYAGMCYLKMGDFKKAIKELEDFSGKGTLVENVARGALGDAYMEDGKTDKAIESYNKAVRNEKDNAITPLYLFRLGIAYEMDKKPEDAKKAYRRIRDEFPASMQARDMDKYLARLGDVE